MAGFDAAGITKMLAPWMTGNTFSPSDYGGPQNLGANLLAQSGPTQQPMSTGERLGLALLGAQQSGLKNAAGRQSLAMNSLNTQFALQKFPIQLQMMRAALERMGGSGVFGGQSPQAGPQAPGTPGGATPQTLVPVPGTPGQGAPQAAQGAPQGAPQAVPQGMPGAGGMGMLDAGALWGLSGQPGAAGLTAAGNARLKYDPALALEMALPKNALVQDQALYNQAAARGDKLGMNAAYMKYLSDAKMVTVGSWNGNVNTFGGITPQSLGMSNVSPQQGTQVINGMQSLIPGAAATKGAIAGATAGGTLRGQTAPAGGGYGGGTPGAAPVGGAPGGQPLAHPQRQGIAALNDPAYIPPILSAPGMIKQQTGNTGLTAIKSSQQQQGELVKETLDDFTKQATSAQELLTTTKQIQQTAQDFTPGKFSTWKGEALNTLNSLNLLPKGWQNSLGSYQEGSKLTIQSQAMVTKALGSREAAQVFDKLGKSIPGLTLSADGLGKISAYQEGMARYKLAQSGFAHKLYDAGNLPGVLGVSTTFQAHTDPTYYILASASPTTRAELLRSMSAGNRSQVLSGWQKAVKLGLAPAPNDYAQ